MRKILNIGAIANDGTGDKLRHAFDLSQQNFVELYEFFGDGENITSLSVRQKLDTPTNSEVDQKVSAAINPVSDHIVNKSNPHGVTKAQVGLSNVDNTSDANKPISTETQKALDLKADKSDVNEALDLKADKTKVSQQLSLKEDGANKGAENGYASLDENKKVPISELPVASATQKGILQVINDLSTGGTDKALTAEMGKVLKALDIASAGTYRDMKSQRVLGVNYTNTKESPIFVSVRRRDTGGAISITVDGVMVDATTAVWSGVAAIVPRGSRYSVSHDGDVETWVEL